MRVRPKFEVRKVEDGRAMLNLGSSARTAPGWNNVDFSWLIRLSKRPNLSQILLRAGILSEFRYHRICSLDKHAILWDLRKGIPFEDKTFDAVYHCHVLEHIERESAPGFLSECYRVLKPGAVLRVVVPDLEILARNYLEAIGKVPQAESMEQLRLATEEIFDQMVQRVPKTRKDSNALVRFAETILIGDTARAGILHRWMYDRFSLSHLLAQVGFVNMQRHTPVSSAILGWPDFCLDTFPDGEVYKPDSLYLEGVRP
jgi:SAM-dependent methyltransferase